MSRRLIPFLLLLVIASVMMPVSADEAASRRDALREAQEPLRARQWADATVRLRAFRETHPGTEEAIQAWVLEARALLLAGQAQAALESTSAFLARHGEAAWAGRIKHTAADAYAKLGQGKEAADVLRGRVDAATSKEARAAIASLHVRLADEDYDGVETKDDLGRPTKQRDVARALTSYQHALEVGLAPAEALRVRERVALCQEELKQFADAVGTWEGLLAELKRGEIQADGVQRQTWLVGRGRAALGAGDLDAARKDLREALEAEPQGALALEVLLLLGEERLRTAQAKQDDVAFEEGVTWIRRGILEHRGDARALGAQRRLAESYEQRGQSEKAAAEWGALIERFPGDPSVAEARDRRAQALARAGRFDDAIREWEQFLAAHPNDPRWQAVRGNILDAAYQKGAALSAADEPVLAVAAYRAFAEAYPTDARAPQALFAVGTILRGEKDFEGAIKAWRHVEGRYASTASAPQALWMIALTLEDDLGRLEDAVKGYEQLIERYPGTGEAGEAALRLERLKAKHLELRMERVVGLDQPATLRVVTRNIPQLTVHVYRLEMEEYFRRKGTVLGVENLQLEVVKPDETAAWTIDGYKPFGLYEVDQTVPVEGAGAYVVVAGDEDLTATVLFLVSDVEVIVKKARGRDLLVWASERETQAPVVGARVLIAEGGKVREVGRTGPDGVWHDPKGGLADHVLVLGDKGLAATGLEQGPSVSAGFSSKAYVTTDRPVYRPGHEVNWRAVYLEASGGAYQRPSKHQGRVLVRDARGQTVLDEATASSDMGAFAGSFLLDGAAPLGVYTVQVTVPYRGSWTGEFEVQEFRKPELTVSVTPVQPVVLTGELVKMVAEVKYAFGGPVVDAPLAFEIYRNPKTYAPATSEDYAWYFQDDRAADETRKGSTRGTLVQRGLTRTDDAGEAVIEFETAELDEDAEYIVRVAVEDVTRRWIVDQGRIPVTRRDHMAVVKADRKVYRPKQTMRIDVRTMDALERPVARDGRLRLLEIRRRPVETETRGGRRPSRLVEEEIERASYPLTTGKDGSAEIRVDVPGPGTWRLQWQATDGRGALVTAQTDVEAAGEAEDLSRDARLVAARSVVKEGESAEVLLQSPVTGVKALLTYEGEMVLAYRFIEVDRSSTLLNLPVEADHAPNVFFAVAIPGKGELYEADTEVVVLRTMDVDVSMPADARPGETVPIRVTTTDVHGKPVKAEVGLALIDETLYAIAPDRAPAMRPYFYDQRRTNAVTTASSIGFTTTGTTTATNKDLLADEAARSGDLQKAMALSMLRNAREAMDRGDVRTAAILALRATEGDPSNFEARAFVAELRESGRARKALERLDREVLKELQSTAAMEPAASPRPGAPVRFADARTKDKSEDMDELYEDAESEEAFDGPATNGVIGLGGGAGGAFRGRGGGRTLSAGGGGRRAQDSKASLPAELARYGGNKKALEKAMKQGYDAFGLEAGTFVESRQRFADTAAWQPHLVTGDDGQATVEIELPDNLTTWRAVVRGVSSTALVGEGRGRLPSRKPLVVRIDAPRFLVQGDQLTIPVAVHNETGASQEIAVRVAAEGIRLEGVDATTRLVVPNGGNAIDDRAFDRPEPGRLRIEATATAASAADRTEVGLPALPRGIAAVEGRTGVIDTARGSTQETFLDVPAGAIPGATKLAIVLYPGIDAAVLDALLYLDLFPYGCTEQTVHRFLPALAAREALRAAGSPDAARLDGLDEAVRRGVARLANLQHPDGSFGWFAGGQGDLAMTAYALLGLAGARDGGVAGLDDAIRRAEGALRNLLGAGDEDRRALGHLALASIGVMENDIYATTFRRRNDDLSVAGLSWMALAAQRLGRGYDVDELVRLLLDRKLEDGVTTHWAGRRENCFVGSDREATGLAVAALLAAKREGEQAKRGLRWLLAHRLDGGFGSTKDTAAFVLAAASWVRDNGAQAFGGTVEVLVDDQVVRTIRTGPGGLEAKDRRFLVPDAARWAPGRHRLAFRLVGQGDLHWAARMESVVASDELVAETHGMELARRFLRPEEAPVEGGEPPVKPGYTVLRPSARPRVEVRDLERVLAGDRVLVRLEIDAPRELEYVLIEDPLPAGFEVLEDTTSGSFDWQERRDDRQVFFCSKLPKGPTVLQYVLQATHWGRFTALGTKAHAMYLPEVHARGAGSVLEVVDARGSGIDVETPPTPDELYAQAKRLFGDGERRLSLAGLRQLRDEQPLRDEIVEEIEAMLLEAAVEADDAKEIVRAREALVRRDAGRIPQDWETQRRIAFAYHALGEYEVASRLYDDLVSRGFGLEYDWAGTLARRQREIDGLDAIEKALRRFPISNTTADVAFRAAQRYRELPRPEGRGGPAGKPMDEETLDALWAFTAWFAETPLADPGNYAVVEALRRAGDLVGASVAAEKFLQRFPGSMHEDDTWYFLAESRFRRFEKDPTPARAQAVREAAEPLVRRTFADGRGNKTESEYKVRALHLLARVHHVLGELDQAVGLYWEARSLEDAREAYDFLTEERLDLEETVVLDLEGKATFPLRYRNVGEVTFKAYPVDLQVLFAVRKSLAGLHDVDLSGIVPAFAWTETFADGKDHQGHRRDVVLPVEPGEPGAWLVVAKAGDHEAKTLVIKTDLVVVLQRVGEKVRVYVTTRGGDNVAGAYVTVSDGSRIRARGITDGRGLFEAPGVGSSAAVVVSDGDSYAIAR